MSKPKMVRINVYSEANEDITFDISVPEKRLHEVKQIVGIAGLRWYNDPDYAYSGWAEPLEDMLTEKKIPFVLHKDLDEDVAIFVPYVYWLLDERDAETDKMVRELEDTWCRQTPS